MNGEEAFKRGLEFYEQKEYSKAIECFKKAIGDEGYAAAHGNAWNNMGSAYAALGEYEKSINCFKEAIEDENFTAPDAAWCNKGIAYGNLGDHKKAIDCFKEVISDKKYRNSDIRGKVLDNIGVAYENLGDHKKAIEYYKKSIEDEKFDTPGNAYYGMGISYRNLGDHKKAIEYYKKAIQHTPKYADAYNNLGEVFLKLKKYTDAEEQFRKAIQINFDLPDSHYNLGIILTNEECYEDAKKEYEIALKFKPTDADYLNSLGYVLVELGQYEKAKENFKKAISSDPAHSKAHHNLRVLKKISETKYSSLKYVRMKLRKYSEKVTSSETKYWTQSLFRYGFILFIIYMICDTRKLLDPDKLSGTEFVALIVFLMSLLTVMILFPDHKYIKQVSFEVGPSGVKFLVNTDGKMVEPEPVVEGIEIVNNLKSAPPTKHQEAP